MIEKTSIEGLQTFQELNDDHLVDTIAYKRYGERSFRTGTCRVAKDGDGLCFEEPGRSKDAIAEDCYEAYKAGVRGIVAMLNADGIDVNMVNGVVLIGQDNDLIMIDRYNNKLLYSMLKLCLMT